jgi:hypothetical protein
MARIVHVASFVEVWKTIRRHEYGRGGSLVITGSTMQERKRTRRANLAGFDDPVVLINVEIW